ncbi:lamin tail domain-containing protein [Paenibacillus nasutitermitis]|uniref:LTD domain-containing protein n=1 Tax=Paenibacillus nasutitermitis TaxID=1652958 RepID=A0A916YLQ2_9BACL|nr:lamin tail domain-containing protein [Paenibacillus nasutitermitis]GGD50657.1 hypothetical protein GCM10010911_05250 [Paenibacillus nasutitermitis]
MTSNRSRLRTFLGYRYGLLVFALLLLLSSMPAGGIGVAEATVIPQVRITEMVPQPNKSASDPADSYEYIELHNAGSSSIDLADYRFKVSTSVTTSVYWDITTSKTIPAGGVMVVWIYNSASAGLTLTDFNTHYGVSLTTANSMILNVTGMLLNTGSQKVVLALDTGEEVSVAKYNDVILNNTNKWVDTAIADAGIVYEYPEYEFPGNIAMRKVASNQKATPGVLPSYRNWWITEVMPNSSADGGSPNDAYEYIELYNHSSSAIDLAGYKFQWYYNTASPSDFVPWDMSTNRVIPAKSRVVVWLQRTESAGKTIADFKNHYDSYVDDSVVYPLYTGPEGLANTGKKKLALLTDAGTEVSSIIYNDGTANDMTATVDTTEDKSIVFNYPVDNTTKMRKVATGQYATPGETYNWFYGDVHAHTAVAEALGTPADAYKKARERGADFFFLSDHAEGFDNRTNYPLSEEWKMIRTQADEHNVPSTYSAFSGFEIAYNHNTGYYGHLNVFNTEWFYERYNKSYPDLFGELRATPEAIAQFNHPEDHFGDFNDFVNPDGDPSTYDLIPLIEVRTDHQFEYFKRGLDKGWHFAPTFGGDNHSKNWLGTQSRTVVLAEQNTRESMLDAMRSRRVYSSYGDADLRVRFKINGAEMGSKLVSPGMLNIDVTATNPTSDNISNITVYSNSGRIVATQSYVSRKARLTASLPPQYGYYFARVEQADGDWAVTAPIWIADPMPLEISMGTRQVSGTAPVQVEATIHNSGTVPLSNVKVEFFKNNWDAGNKIDETTLPSIAASGSAMAVTAEIPASAGLPILVQATATVGGVSRTISSSVIVPELLITEMSGNSPGGSGADVDEFDFIEVYNNTKSAIDLGDYAIRYDYTDENKKLEIEKSFAIPAQSAKVFWLRLTGSTKTLADFNSAYGTSLTASDVYILDAHPDQSKALNGNATWVKLVRDSGDAVVSMAIYNEGSSTVHGPMANGEHVISYLDTAVDGSSVVYGNPLDGTYRMSKLSANQPPTPGTVLSSQLPPN